MRMYNIKSLLQIAPSYTCLPLKARYLCFLASLHFACQVAAEHTLLKIFVPLNIDAQGAPSQSNTVSRLL